jgi:hypothetical protein
MNLSALGFDQWFEARIGELNQAGRGIARVSAVDRGSYLIRNETGEVPAELAGKFSFQVESPVDLPCVSAIRDHFVDVNKTIQPNSQGFLDSSPTGFGVGAAVKNSFTAAVTWQARDLEQTIARNVAQILEAS